MKYRISLKALLIWIVGAVIANVLIFGVGTAFWFFIVQPNAADGSAFSMTSIPVIGAYSAFHALLMSFISLPFIIFPIGVWVVVTHFKPTLDDNKFNILFGLGIISALAILCKATLLQYSVVRNNPLSLIKHVYYLVDWIAVWGGISIPRLFIPSLRRLSLGEV